MRVRWWFSNYIVTFTFISQHSPVRKSLPSIDLLNQYEFIDFYFSQWFTTPDLESAIFREPWFIAEMVFSKHCVCAHCY